MDAKTAAAYLSENLPAVYGYALARLYDKTDAEDLAGEIVCEILASAENLKSQDAFWGFAWKIAENTFRKFSRKKQLLNALCHMPEEKDIGVIQPSPEEVITEKESDEDKLYRLRQELSLLTKQYREVTVSYYVHGKRCHEIASEQNISVEMVKYYLYKTRKLLKEGIGMTRKLGEKSYNPGVFRMDFWGDRNYYAHIFDRKLPGSIVLAAYDVPMTKEKLSLELGVSMPYLEDELDILEAAGLLKKTGNSYQTNLVILTEAYEKEFVQSTAAIYEKTANAVFADALALLPKVRALNFHTESCYDDNRLLWTILNIAMIEGFTLASKHEPIGKAPKLALGGYGRIFGYDNDYRFHHFHGITMRTEKEDGTVWFSAVNYRIIERCQLYSLIHFDRTSAAMWDAILSKPANPENPALPELIENGFIRCENDILSANFPVFENAVFETLSELLRPTVEVVSACMIDISDKAAAILAEHAPAAVRDQCPAIAKIHHRLDVMAFLIEKMVENGQLIVPQKRTNLCIFGVKTTS